MNLAEDSIRHWGLIGVDEIEIGLDSQYENINDSIRGSGNYKQVHQVIKWFKQYGVQFGISSVFYKKNFGEYKTLGDYSILLGAKAYNGSEVQLRGRAKLNCEELRLSIEEIVRITIYNIMGYGIKKIIFLYMEMIRVTE